GALAWSLLLSPSAGLINIGLRDLGMNFSINAYSLPGMIFVLTLYYCPYAFLLIYGALRLMDPDLEDAAVLHGAQPRRMIRTTTTPLLTPAISGAAILIFALSISNFPVNQILGEPRRIHTLPTFIF